MKSLGNWARCRWMLNQTLVLCLVFHLTLARSIGFKSASGQQIRPFSCTGKVAGAKGVCMFALDCRENNGTHLGICIDLFYYGSCCDLPLKNSVTKPRPTSSWVSTTLSSATTTFASTTPSSTPSTTLKTEPVTTETLSTELSYFESSTEGDFLGYVGSSDTTTDSYEEAMFSTTSMAAADDQVKNGSDTDLALTADDLTTVAALTTTSTTVVIPTTTSTTAATPTTFPSSTTTESTTTIPPSTTRFSTASSTTTTEPTTTTEITTTDPSTTTEVTTTTTNTPMASSTTTTTTTTTLSTTSSIATTGLPDIGDGFVAANLAEMDYQLACGRQIYKQGPSGRIVNGQKTTFGKWPWQISLRQWKRTTFMHKCGAALLNDNWAITAAHCVDGVPPEDLLLRIGEFDLSSNTEPLSHVERRVQIMTTHPDFNPRTFENDLALLRFYEPITFRENIIPICLPSTDDTFVNKTGYVTGWGRLYVDGPLPNILQEVQVPVITNSDCEQEYRKAGFLENIPNIFLCAGYDDGGRDSCEGDSGGPLVIKQANGRWTLAGIISWGIGCAEPHQPGVYTRISHFREWINRILVF